MIILSDAALSTYTAPDCSFSHSLLMLILIMKTQYCAWKTDCQNLKTFRLDSVEAETCLKSEARRSAKTLIEVQIIFNRVFFKVLKQLKFKAMSEHLLLIQPILMLSISFRIELRSWPCPYFDPIVPMEDHPPRWSIISDCTPAFLILSRKLCLKECTTALSTYCLEHVFKAAEH